MKTRKQTAWVAVWIDDDGNAPVQNASFIAPTRTRLIQDIEPFIHKEWRIYHVYLTPATPAKKKGHKR